jgi:hypothetical protein
MLRTRYDLSKNYMLNIKFKERLFKIDKIKVKLKPDFETWHGKFKVFTKKFY